MKHSEDTVVGYQKSQIKAGGYYSVLSSFNGVGKDVTLKDLKVSGDDYTANAIQFLASNGSTRKHTLTAAEKAILGTSDEKWDMVFYYVSEQECIDWDDGTTPGWYFLNDTYMLHNVSEAGLVDGDGKNEIDVSFGHGFIFQPNFPYVQLTWSGEVVKGASTLAFDVGGYSATGNASPVDRDLGYFKVTGDDYTANAIQFLETNGSTRKWTLSKEEKEALGTTDEKWDMVFYYVSEQECIDWDDGTTPGWYFLNDTYMLLNMSAKIDVKAGEGFIFQPNFTNVKLVIPSAL